MNSGIFVQKDASCVVQMYLKYMYINVCFPQILISDDKKTTPYIPKIS